MIKQIALFITPVVCLTAQVTIRDITVVDVAAGLVHAHQTVVVASAGPARVVEGSGKFLMPGLWDMHVSPSVKAPAAPGVVGIHVVGDMVESSRGPRVFTSGATVTEAGPKEARAAFDKRYFADEDFVAFGAAISRDAYIALAEQSRHWRLPLVGPIPPSMSPWEVLDARQATIEGLDGIATMNDSDAAAFFARCATMGTRIAPMLRLQKGNARAQKLVTMAKAAHVELLAASGSDGSAGALMEELQEMRQAGLSPRETLEAATIAPTRTTGFKDMVILDGNPLDDVRNAGRVAAVVLRGIYQSLK